MLHVTSLIFDSNSRGFDRYGGIGRVLNRKHNPQNGTTDRSGRWMLDSVFQPQ